MLFQKQFVVTVIDCVVVVTIINPPMEQQQ